MTYREAVKCGEEILAEAAITEAGYDAWLLMELVCRIDRNFYYQHMEDELSEEQFSEYENVLKKRAEHVPLQYIAGETEFMGLKFKVNSSVLIPRQDTETLVEEALKTIKPGMRVLDLCTGSGCIIISILHNVPDVYGLATDISKQALNVAKENARLHGLAADFEQSDLFRNIVGKFDVIVSNPPYIPSAEVVNLMPEVGKFEPPEALDGKEDGLYYYREMIAACPDYLNPGGRIFFEIGFDQGEEVTGMLRAGHFEEIRVIRDLAGKDRVVTGMKA